MGRREKELDPAAGPVQRLADELRRLRRDAGGPSYRAMAQRAGYSVTALSQAAAGEKLPSLPVLRAYVRVCGGDMAQWEARWHEVLREVTREEAERGDEAGCPYRGLARFEPEDAEYFFGREELLDGLLEQVGKSPVTVLIGPSGSGKSSLLRAGLIPRLRRAEEPGLRPAALRILTPGAHPLGTHADKLTPAGGPGQTWLLVDQFEELFTLCKDPVERSGFLDALLDAQDGGDGALRVVVAVRADFYGHCLEHRGLAAVLREAAVPVGPMGPDELRDAIVKPATARQLVVEKALTARLVEEAGQEPGSLPLLSHALLETWRHRRGRVLSREAYEATGGIRGAVARTAEEAYERLGPEQREIARRVLLRMITPGDGAPDTRRPVARDEFSALDGDGTAEVLERLARARLIILDEQSVDLAHEALITSWPRLRGWVERDRERLRLHRDLTEAARDWEALGRDSGALYRGARLAAVEGVFDSPDRCRDLTGPEAAFLTASRAARDEERSRAAAVARRTRALVASGALLLVLALLAGVVAWQQHRAGEEQRRQNTARRVASVAESLRHSDPRTALRLSVAAWRIAETEETRSALLGGVFQKARPGATPAFLTDDEAVRYGSDGRTLTVVRGGRVERWDTDLGRRISSRAFDAPPEELDGPVLSDDGTGMLFQGGTTGAEVWDTTSLRRTALRLPPDTGLSHVFWAGSPRLIAVYQTGLLELWNTRTGRRAARLDGAVSPEQQYATVAVAPDDRYAATCARDGRIELWDLARRSRLPARGASLVFGRGNCDGITLAFARKGHRVLVMDARGVHAVDVPSGRAQTLVEHAGLTEFTLSADGGFLAASSGDELLLWRLAPETAPDVPVFRYPLVNQSASHLRIDTERAVIRYLGSTGGSGFGAHTLDAGTALRTTWRRTAAPAQYSPDGRWLATERVHGEQGFFELADTRDGGVVYRLPPVPLLEAEAGMAASFSADGRFFAYTPRMTGPSITGAPPRVLVWDTLRRRLAATFEGPRKGLWFEVLATASHEGRPLVYAAGERTVWELRRGTKVVEHSGEGLPALTLRPDGKLLVVNHTMMVRLPDGKMLATRPEMDHATATAFSDDGRYLAVAEDTGNLAVWDGAGRQRLGTLAPGPDSPERGNRDTVSALAFSADSTILATGSNHGAVRLWHIPSSRPVGGLLPGTGDRVDSLAFDGGRELVRTVGPFTGPQVADIGSERAAARICARAGGPPSPADWAARVPEVPYRDVCHSTPG